MTSKEAFKRLKFIADNELNTGSKSYKDLQEFWNYKEPLKVITDLVERDTPMKVDLETTISLNYYCKKTSYKCPKCGVTIIERWYNYCPVCGQKLDWSE